MTILHATSEYKRIQTSCKNKVVLHIKKKQKKCTGEKEKKTMEQTYKLRHTDRQTISLLRECTTFLRQHDNIQLHHVQETFRRRVRPSSQFVEKFITKRFDSPMELRTHVAHRLSDVFQKKRRKRKDKEKQKNKKKLQQSISFSQEGGGGGGHTVQGQYYTSL